MFQNPYYPPYQPPAQRLQQYEQFRNPQNVLKCMAVTSIDEAQGTMIDLDGSVTVFADLSNGKIYTKQIGMDGKAILNTYELQRPKPPAADATEERFQRIENAIVALKGEIDNVKSSANDAGVRSAKARCQTGIHHLQPIRCERRMLWQLLVYGYTPKERCHAALFS